MVGTLRVTGAAILRRRLPTLLIYSARSGPAHPSFFDRCESLRLPMNYLRALPFLVVFAVILFSGLRPEPVPQVFDQQDKLHHMLGFAALTFTLRLAFPQWRAFWTIAASLGAALLIEIGQSLLPNRQASLGDMLANTLGVFLGWGCSHLAYLWYLRRIGITTTPETADENGRLGSTARP